MEESNYKHNYEYLSIEEAKTIVNGTFVQGTTNIGGELATKADIDGLLATANKRLTSIVPSTEVDNEFICFFECEDIETFPDEWTYVFHYDVSGASGSSSTPTSWTKQYNVDGQQINNNLVLNGITSYKIKTGSLGTVQRENVSYSGQVGSPSGYNYSEQEATGSGHLTQDGSGKQLQWSYTQNANVKVWNISADKTSLSFPANGGTRSVQITTWYTWQYNNNNNQKFDQNTTTENITAEANTLQQQKTWTKVITKNNKSVSIQCTQEGAQEQFPDDLQHRWIEITPTNAGNFTEAGGTITVTGSYGLTGSFGTRKTVGQINDTITVERNTTTQTKSGSKTYYYNNTHGTNPSATVTWTQDAHVESFTYRYYIYIGQNADTIQQERMQLVWQSDQYNQSSKKTVFVKAYKNKINEHNQIVSTDSVEYGIKDEVLNNQFTITDSKNGQIYCYPLKENSSYQDSKIGSFIVYIKESEDISCKVNLIQDRKGIQIISGDAVMFTYNWNEGTDLDQATFVNLNLKGDHNDNYAGYSGYVRKEYENILYFAGDNTGKGNEYAFIDFKNIAKYLIEHRDDQSSIIGKTILQSLTDDNGTIKIQCDLYTNWYVKKLTENITLSYSVYNKDSEDAAVTTSNKQFILTGYTQINNSSDQALCYAEGKTNVRHDANVKDGYTLSAKFTYYLDSGVFAFETNKDNVGKWHKGAVLNPVKCNPSYSNVQFTNDGNNINFSISIDSIGVPDYFDKNCIVWIKPRIQQKGGSLSYDYTTLDYKHIKINQLPYKIESSTPLAKVIKNMHFGENNTAEIMPMIFFEGAVNNYIEEKYAEINTITLERNVLTLQKQSS